MKEEALVTIIVPIYNAQKELEKCLDSILAQTYENLEILLIDDGSKDDSLKIAEQYAKNNKKIQVFHQENRGVSCARNLGIERSAGKYISFVDADDWISESFIEKLVETIQGADLAIVGYNLCREQIEPVVLEKDGSIDREAFFFENLCKIHSSCWDKLFLSSIIKEKNILFEEEVYFSEDTIFVMNYYRFCSNVAYCKEPLYQYRYNSQSVTHMSKIKEFNMKRVTLLVLSDRIEEWYSNENEFIKNCIIYRRVRTYIYLIFHMVKCQDYRKELAKAIQKDIRKYYVEFIKFEGTPLIQKLAAILICISSRITYLIGRVAFCLIGGSVYE